MKTATLVLLEWVDSHIKALKEIEEDKGRSFVIEGGIKALEEVREEILRVSNDVEKPMMINNMLGNRLLIERGQVESNEQMFNRKFKTCPQP